MAYSDNVALFQARMAANAPYASVGGSSVLFNLAQGFLSADSDTQYYIQSTAPDLAVSTASGSALDARAADYGVIRGPGTPATVSLVFSVPQAATSTIIIPISTNVATVGDGITSVAVAFTTTQQATINVGQTSSNAVSATATTSGSNTDVAAGAVTQILTGVGTGNLSVTNAAGATGGTDADTDAVLRNKVFVAIGSKYGAAVVQAAILTVSGVFDAFAYDPQDATGKILYYWCDVNGNVSGISGGTSTGASPYHYLTGPTLTGTALTVDNAIRSYLPPNIQPFVGAEGSTTSPFVVTLVTAVNVSYTAPSTISSSTIQPQIQSAVVAYIQTLLHNQVPTQFGMAQYVQNAVGNVLTNFIVNTINSVAPSSLTASPTKIYRCTGTPSSVVSFT